MSLTCRDMLGTTRRVAPILARWVRVADTKLKMSWQFVGSSRHLPDYPKCVCRNILWYGSTYAQILSHLSTLISVMFSILSCSPHETKITTTLLNTTADTTAHHVRQHHPPMPPTKAMGAIKQNRRGHPTATP
jgi:hypothetical protein